MDWGSYNEIGVGCPTGEGRHLFERALGGRATMGDDEGDAFESTGVVLQVACGLVLQHCRPRVERR